MIGALERRRPAWAFRLARLAPLLGAIAAIVAACSGGGDSGAPGY